MPENGNGTKLCHECEQEMVVDETGVSYHLDEDGNVDHDADADHVALDPEEVLVDPGTESTEAIACAEYDVRTDQGMLCTGCEYEGPLDPEDDDG